MKKKATDYLSKVARDTQQMLEKGVRKVNSVKEKAKKTITDEPAPPQLPQQPAS